MVFGAICHTYVSQPFGNLDLKDSWSVSLKNGDCIIIIICSFYIFYHKNRQLQSLEHTRSIILIENMNLTMVTSSMLYSSRRAISYTMYVYFFKPIANEMYAYRNDGRVIRIALTSSTYNVTSYSPFHIIKQFPPLDHQEIVVFNLYITQHSIATLSIHSDNTNYMPLLWQLLLVKNTCKRIIWHYMFFNIQPV